MKNSMDALEGDSDSILATITSALPRLEAQKVFAIAYIIAGEDMQPLMVTYHRGKFAMLNLAKTIPNWMAVDAGNRSV